MNLSTKSAGLRRQGFLQRNNLVWLVPLISTVCFYWLISALSVSLFGRWLHDSAELLDFAAQLLVAYALFTISRRVWAFLVVQLLFMVLLYFCNAVMIRFFQMPIGPADVHSLGALVKVLPPLKLAYIAAPIVVMVGLFLWNLNVRVARIVAFLVLLGVPTAMAAFSPARYVAFVDSKAENGYQPWAQLQVYLDRGPVLYFTEAMARAALETSPTPSQAEVEAALPPPLHSRPYGAGGAVQPKRNVYVILVESFWNPAALSAAHLSADPWPVRLERLWAETGYSRALSPVFGHLTANAEYEVLCGEPALTEAAIFVTSVTRPLPCLPRFLAQHGYITIAQHPNEMNFWNRVSAYRYLGFERYYSRKDFDLDELDGAYLSDRSLFRQAATHTRQLVNEKPFFSYIMTLAGHYPYNLTSRLHPDVIATQGNGLIHAEVNSIHYTAKALLGYIEHLQAVDPTGLIVIAGDHLPSYEEASVVYPKSNLFPLDPAKSTPTALANRLGTPLIVINGQRGPVKMGSVPMYELAARIVDMLGFSGPSIFGAFRSADGLHMRPYHNRTLVLKGNEPSAVCHAGLDSEICAAAAQWRKRAEVISADLLAGQQYVVTEVLGPGYTFAEPSTDFDYIPHGAASPCKVDVVKWGPRAITEGHTLGDSYNASALWVVMKGASPDVMLRFDGKILATARRPGVLTGSLKGLGAFDDPGRYPLDAVCRYSRGVVHIGTFVVRAKDKS